MTTHPKLLILDEATEGLAPLVRQEIWTGLKSLKDQGLSILVVDKNIHALSKIADRHHILSKGRVVWSGDSTQLLSDRELHDKHLGV